MPSANTVKDAVINAKLCKKHLIPLLFKCLLLLCPKPLIGIPLANTVPKAPCLLGCLQCFGPLSWSPFLATAGIPVFMDDEKRCDYNLNLLN